MSKWFHVAAAEQTYDETRAAANDAINKHGTSDHPDVDAAYAKHVEATEALKNAIENQS